MVNFAEVLNKFERMLKRGNFSEAVAEMRLWLSSAQPGDPEELLAQCEKPLRPKIALLLRDLLSRYPATIVGCPVLVYPTRSDESVGKQPLLPIPGESLRWPCSDLHFLGWAQPHDQLPLSTPIRTNHGLAVEWQAFSCAIALFRSKPEVFDLETVDLPSMWWGELFLPFPGNIRISARMILPYPDALEASRVLQAAARQEPYPKPGYFLSDAGWSWACNEGLLFQDTCRDIVP